MCTSSAFRVGLPPGHARRTSVSRPTTAPNRSTSAAASARSTGDSVTHRPRWRSSPSPSTVGADTAWPARGGEGGDARPEVVLGRREPDPVLEGIDGGRSGEAFPHQEEPGRTDGSEAFESCLLFGPAKKDDIGTGLRIHHKEKVKSGCYGLVTPP